MSQRLLSKSEIGTLLDCERRHGFAYTGHLTSGYTLRKKAPAITLRRGRAWGRAVAAWHETGDAAAAALALVAALDEDAQEQEAAGIYSHEEHVDLVKHLTGLLGDYMATAERMPLTDAELELQLPLPSRTGKRLSNRYAFQGYVDGLTREFRLPGLWVVEFKLRDRLSSFESVAWSRDVRWYAWAAERQLGEPVQGVIVDERLNEAPRPARWVNAKRKGEGIDGKVPSHAVDQLTTPDAYRAACKQAGVEAQQDTLDSLAARDWQRRHPVFLRRDEIAEAGKELVSAGMQIAELDSGLRFPVANRGPFTCPRCPYKEICARPDDLEVIALDFDLTEPKRLRPQKDEDAMSTEPVPVAA